MKKTNWLEQYRSNKSAIWINVMLTNGQEFYYDKYDGWLSIKEKCEKDALFVKELTLQFRSHEVEIDLTDAEGVYLIRSAMGQFGGTTKNYFTTGILKQNKVYKKMWIVPELVVDKEIEDNIEDCFEEALIYAKKN